MVSLGPCGSPFFYFSLLHWSLSLIRANPWGIANIPLVNCGPIVMVFGNSKPNVLPKSFKDALSRKVQNFSLSFNHEHFSYKGSLTFLILDKDFEFLNEPFFVFH